MPNAAAVLQSSVVIPEHDDGTYIYATSHSLWLSELHKLRLSSLLTRSEAAILTALPNDPLASHVTSTDVARQAVILCVERDPHVRELESYFLTEAGFEVTFAADGIEALKLARTLRPVIIITEILVPKLDGLALCQRLKSDESTKGIAVLVFSLLAAAGRAQDAGADAFLGKPLAAQQLTNTVRELLAPIRSKSSSAAQQHSSPGRTT